MTLARLPQARALRDVPVATAAQMAEVDRITSEDVGVALETLMENACRQIARVAALLLGSADGKRVIAVAGTGNNGGDALGALRHLRGQGASVEALVAGPRERLRGLAAAQHDLLSALDARVRDSAGVTDFEFIQTYKNGDLILDGLLGYSTSGEPRGEVKRLIKDANAARGYGMRPVLAVDLPSGLHPDEGRPLSDVPDETIRATLTVTLGLPKPGLIRESARAYVGELVLADIGIPAAAYERVGIDASRVFDNGDLVRVVS